MSRFLSFIVRVLRRRQFILKRRKLFYQLSGLSVGVGRYRDFLFRNFCRIGFVFLGVYFQWEGQEIYLVLYDGKCFVICRFVSYFDFESEYLFRCFLVSLSMRFYLYAEKIYVFRYRRLSKVSFYVFGYFFRKASVGVRRLFFILGGVQFSVLVLECFFGGFYRIN